MLFPVKMLRCEREMSREACLLKCIKESISPEDVVKHAPPISVRGSMIIDGLWRWTCHKIVGASDILVKGVI